jgi:hypothetical protein
LFFPVDSNTAAGWAVGSHGVDGRIVFEEKYAAGSHVVLTWITIMNGELFYCTIKAATAAGKALIFRSLYAYTLHRFLFAWCLFLFSAMEAPGTSCP